MARKHFMRTVGCPASTSDSKLVAARRNYLAETHEERLKEIAEIHLSEPSREHKTFNSNCKLRVKNVSVKKPSGPYVIIWGKKVYIPEDKVEATMECGMRVYLD